MLSWTFFLFSLDPTPKQLQQPPTPPSDNIDWKSKCVQLQEIVAQHQDKLENCQKEIDVQKNDFRYNLFLKNLVYDWNNLNWPKYLALDFMLFCPIF